MEKKRFSRRDFLKWSGMGSLAVSAMPHAVAARPGKAQQDGRAERHEMFAALGDTLIPTDPGDPGYKSLEQYKITEEVMKKLDSITDADLSTFNEASAALFDGRKFLQLTPSQRADYLRLIIDGSKFTDKSQLKVLQRVYRQV